MSKRTNRLCAFANKVAGLKFCSEHSKCEDCPMFCDEEMLKHEDGRTCKRRFVDIDYTDKLQKAINLLFDKEKRETKETQEFLDRFIDAPFVYFDCISALASKIFDATPIEQRGDNDQDYFFACEDVARLYLEKYSYFSTKEYWMEQLKRAMQ